MEEKHPPSTKLLVGDTVSLPVEKQSSSSHSISLRHSKSNKSFVVASLFINFCVFHFFVYTVFIKPYFLYSPNDAVSSIETKSNGTIASRSYRHDNQYLFKVEQCTEKQIEGIEIALGITSEKMNQFKVNCPSSSWLDEYYTRLYDMHRNNPEITPTPFLGINVGCNKGYDAINMARMGMLNPHFNHESWRQALEEMGLDKKGSCRQGSKSDEFQYPFSSQNSALSPIRRGETHCIEPMPSTFQVINGVAQKLRLDKEGLVMTQAAISSTDGTIDFPNANAGVENLGIHTCKEKKRFCESVPMYSLETYVDTFVHGQGPINILSIDVEGFDFDVLFGAGSVLDRTEYLEFEFHEVGNWGGYHLTDSIRLLDTKGFTCYWAGVDKLWRITGCQHPLYEKWHGWSNVACVHRSTVGLAKIMEQLFLKSIQTSNYV